MMRGFSHRATEMAATPAERARRSALAVTALALLALGWIPFLGSIDAGLADDPGAFDPPDVYLHAIGNSDAPGHFLEAGGLAVSPVGAVYMTDLTNHRVQAFRNGVFDLLWGGPGDAEGRFVQPRGLAIAADGTVFVADTMGKRVQAFTADGKLTDGWGTYPDQASGRAFPFAPRWVAVTEDDLVVTDDWLRNHILVFQRDGTLVDRWHVPASPNGSESEVRALALDGTGHLVIAQGNGSVGRFTIDGAQVASWTATNVVGMAATAERCYYVDPAAGLFWTDLQGHRLGDLPVGAPLGPGTTLVSPRAVAVASDGAVFVVDRRIDDASAWLVELGEDGAFVRQRSGGRPAAGAMGPGALARDGASRVYVADALYGRVQVFHPDGTIYAVWGDGLASDDIRNPVGIAHAIPDYTFVADAGRGVLRLDADGEIDLTFGIERGQGPGQFGETGPTDLATPLEISSAPRLLRVVDPDNARVQMFDLDGTWRGEAGSEGNGAGQFCKGCAVHVATDVTGHSHVSTWLTDLRVHVFDVNGAYERTYAGHVGQDSRIASIADLAIGAGHVFMPETRNRVQVLDMEGAHFADIETHHARPDMAIEPGAVAVAPGARRMFVADGVHGRVHVFGAERWDTWHVTVHPNTWVAEAPVMVAETRRLAFEWLDGTPSPGLDPDAFSLYASTFVPFPEGETLVTVLVDGKVRLWIDDDLVVDEWHEARTGYSVPVDPGSGEHFVQLEYADTSGQAIVDVQFGVEPPSGWVTVVPGDTPTPAATTAPSATPDTPVPPTPRRDGLALPMLIRD